MDRPLDEAIADCGGWTEFILHVVASEHKGLPGVHSRFCMPPAGLSR